MIHDEIEESIDEERSEAPADGMNTGEASATNVAPNQLEECQRILLSNYKPDLEAEAQDKALVEKQQKERQKRKSESELSRPSVSEVPEIGENDGPTLKLDEDGAHSLIGTTVVGRYEIVSRLSKSPTSSVYKALHLLMDRFVALRMLVASDIQSVKRFQIEAKIASALTHANLVSIHDFGVSQGRPYLVTDYVEGRTLAQLIKERGALPVPFILDVACQLCDALNYVHKQDLLFRALRPSKIYVVDTAELSDFVRVCDFGISERLMVDGKEVNNLANSGILYSDPNYMSPEFCLAVKLDPRSDVYSLGCVLYEALTGSPPFADTSPSRIMHKQVTKEAPQVERLDAPDHLIKIIMRALEKDPDRRYKSVEAMWTDLEVLKHGTAQREKKPAPPVVHERKLSMKTQRRIQKLSSFLGMLLLGVLIGLGLNFKEFYAPPAGKAPAVSKAGWHELNKEGEEAFAKGHFQEAERLLGAALARAGGFAPDDQRLATTFNNLGDLYFTLDLYPEAENALKKALAIREKAGAESQDVANSLDDLAMVYMVEGRIAEAEPMAVKAFEIRKKLLKPDHEDIAHSLVVMASLYQKQGKLKDSMTALKRALFIRKHALGPEHPDVATTYNCLAVQHQLAGDLVEARTCYQRAHDIGIAAFGEDHPIVADSLVGLGTIAYLDGKSRTAEEMFKQALDIRQGLLGKDSFRVGEVYSCLGILEEKRGRLNESENYFRRAIDINEDALGPASEQLARSLTGLSRVLKRQGKRDEALAVERRAQNIEKQPDAQPVK